MNIIRRADPFKEIERFFDDQDFFGFVPAVRRNLVPPMDIYEDGDSVVVELEVGSMDPKNIDLSLEDNLLKIKGEENVEQEHKDRNYYRREIRRGSFERTVSLGQAVEQDSIEAHYDKGMLRIKIKKAVEKTAKKIEIKS